jgi:hypothetical protein
VAAQLAVAARELLLLGQVDERCREAVGAVLLGHAAQPPQRGLQPAGQRHEALALGEHTGVSPTRMRQRELVQPVREGYPADLHAELVGDGEVRQPEPARRVFLREVHVAFGAVHRAPLAQPPLQGAQHADAVVDGVAPLQLFEQRDGVELWVGLQQRDDFAVPHRGQRVLAGAPAARLTLRGQAVARFDAPRAALADGRLGRRSNLRHAVAVFLVLVHLVVRDPLAGHPARLRSMSSASR